MALILYEPLPILGDFHAPERIFHFPGLPNITIKQDWQSQGVAAVVWEAAIVLGTYLQNISSDIKGKQVLELGSGTGLSGIIASLLQADVTFTDLDTALCTCSDNIKLNLDPVIHNFHLKSLNWSEDLAEEWNHWHIDFIIGSDLVYIEELFPDLIKTMSFFFSKNRYLQILLAGKIRYTERYGTFKQMLDSNFLVNQVYFDAEIKVYILKICSL